MCSQKLRENLLARQSEHECAREQRRAGIRIMFLRATESATRIRKVRLRRRAAEPSLSQLV